MTPSPRGIYKPHQNQSRRRPGERWFIDPVTSAGVIKIEEIVKWMANRTKWGKLVHDTLTAQNSEGWCGFSPQKAAVWGPTRDVSEIEIGDLAHSHALTGKRGWIQHTMPVLKIATSRRKKDGSMAAAIFLVEKSKEKSTGKVIARVVYSCRAINKRFNKPPHFRLPSVERIFKCMAIFKKPAFSSLDFRHFFYQIPLPKAAEGMFCIYRTDEATSNTQTWEHQVFPMGFT